MTPQSHSHGTKPIPSGTPLKSEEQRLISLREKLQRLIAGMTRVNAEILAIERQLEDQKKPEPV